MDIEISLEKYYPDAATFINLYRVISRQFKSDFNFYFSHKGKEMLAQIYSGELTVTDITDFSFDKRLKITKCSNDKNIEDYIR
jgi:hypothetical protein